MPSYEHHSKNIIDNDNNNSKTDKTFILRISICSSDTVLSTLYCVILFNLYNDRIV